MAKTEISTNIFKDVIKAVETQKNEENKVVEERLTEAPQKKAETVGNTVRAANGLGFKIEKKDKSKKRVHVAGYLTPEEKKQFEKKCEAYGLSVSDCIRQLIKGFNEYL